MVYGTYGQEPATSQHSALIAPTPGPELRLDFKAIYRSVHAVVGRWLPPESFGCAFELACSVVHPIKLLFSCPFLSFGLSLLSSDAYTFNLPMSARSKPGNIPSACLAVRPCIDTQGTLDD